MIIRTVALYVAIASFASAAPIYYLATDQSGAQTQIDVNHTSTWSFIPNVDFEFGGALLTMKAGQTASEPVRFRLFEGVDASGPTLIDVSLTAAAFCGQVSNCGNWEFHSFFPVAPVNLTSGNEYFGLLTSTAVDRQSKAYFIKDTYFISNLQGTAIQPQPIGALAPEVPEPASWMLMAAGAGMVGLGKWGRTRRSRA